MKLFGILAGLLVAFVTIAGLEAASWVAIRQGRTLDLKLNANHPVPQPARYAIPESLSSAKHLSLGRPYNRADYHLQEDLPVEYVNGAWSMPANVSTEGRMIDENTRATEWTYHLTTDSHRRRITPWDLERRNSAHKHVVFFGCSLTWGVGVGDADTMPAQYGRDLTDTAVYNLSGGGYSIGEILSRARIADDLSDIMPTDGIGVYVMFDQHIPRFHNTAFTGGAWRHLGSVYEEPEPGRFEFAGHFKTDRPVTFFLEWLWNKSSLAHLLNLDLPLMTDDRVDQYFRAVKALRDTYHAKTKPANPFIVVIFPFLQDTGMIRAGLERAEIPYLDYSKIALDFFMPGDGPVHVPGDRHPNPAAYAVFANALKHDLAMYQESLKATPAQAARESR